MTRGRALSEERSLVGVLPRGLRADHRTLGADWTLKEGSFRLACPNLEHGSAALDRDAPLAGAGFDARARARINH